MLEPVPLPLSVSASACTSESLCEVRRRKTYGGGTLVLEFQPASGRKSRGWFRPEVYEALLRSPPG